MCLRIILNYNAQPNCELKIVNFELSLHFVFIFRCFENKKPLRLEIRKIRVIRSLLIISRLAE